MIVFFASLSLPFVSVTAKSEFARLTALRDKVNKGIADETALGVLLKEYEVVSVRLFVCMHEGVGVCGEEKLNQIW